jgi:hypothetical protein
MKPVTFPYIIADYITRFLFTFWVFLALRELILFIATLCLTC